MLCLQNFNPYSNCFSLYSNEFHSALFWNLPVTLLFCDKGAQNQHDSECLRNAWQVQGHKSSCCLLSNGGSIWQMFLFTNFNSNAVSWHEVAKCCEAAKDVQDDNSESNLTSFLKPQAAPQVSKVVTPWSRFIRLCLMSATCIFNQFVLQKENATRSSPHAMLGSSESALSTRMQICSKWSCSCDTQCKDVKRGKAINLSTCLDFDLLHCFLLLACWLCGFTLLCQILSAFSAIPINSRLRWWVNGTSTTTPGRPLLSIQQSVAATVLSDMTRGAKHFPVASPLAVIAVERKSIQKIKKMQSYAVLLC